MTKFVALFVMAVLIASSAAADRSSTDRALRNALVETGLLFARTADGAYVIVFDAEAASDRSNWPVVCTTSDNGEWVLVSCTVLSLGPGADLPVRVLRRLAVENGRRAGAKLTFDPQRGEVDAQDELPAVAIDAESIRTLVHDVAATSDQSRGWLRQEGDY